MEITIESHLEKITKDLSKGMAMMIYLSKNNLILLFVF